MFIRKGMAFMKNSTKRTLIGALFALSLASCNIHIGPSNSPRETSTEESSFSSSSVSEPDPTLDKLEFVLAPNGRSYTVRAKNKDETKGEVVIPSAYQGLPVTVVGDNGFAECSGITSLYLPDTITIIEQAAFIDCTSLKEVRLGDGLTVIDKEAFRRCLATVKPGMYEYEVQAEIEYIFKRNNATGHAYAPIIAGGKNGCCLHYSKNQSLLHDGDLLLFDIGCELKNYSSDLSRTIPINGKFTPRQADCYNAVLRVMKEITKLYKPGGTINLINETTHRLMEQEMIQLGLFTAEDVKRQDPNKPLERKYLMHGMSHHIGLDVHDSIDKFKPFEPGMILTCEPGIYIREEGIGIRIENDLLITEGEPINLFEGLPTEIVEIEAAMR